MSVKNMGWRLDFKKFRAYLEKQYGVTNAYLFLGKIKANENLYKKLRSYGYKIVFKPTVFHGKKSNLRIKGNIDVELALYAAAIEYDNYHKAVIVSGDGDFYSLIKYLLENSKLKKVIVPNHKYSTLLKEFRKYIFLLQEVRQKVENDT